MKEKGAMDIKNRKKIGVIIGQCEQDSQTEALKGIFSKAFEHDMDVLVFSTFLRADSSKSKEASMSDSNIINMVNFDALDGVIYCPDYCVISGYQQRIEEKLEKHCKDKPVVFMDLTSDKYPYILANDELGIKKMVEHFIIEHGFIDIAFVTGPEDNEHSQSRLKGFKEAMKEHSLDIKPNRIFYGDFWYNDGERIVESIAGRHKKLPDVIICASDSMAISVCTALKKRGYDVPRDISVAGYDATPEGKHFDPPITSMSRPMRNTGERTAAKLISMIENTEFVDFFEEKEIIAGSSCLCHGYRANEVARELNDNPYVYIYGYEEEQYSRMLEKLISKTTLEDFCSEFIWLLFQIKGTKMVGLCLNEDWQGDDYLNLDYRKFGYSDRMYLAAKRIVGDDGMVTANVETYRTFDLKEMFPPMNEPRIKPAAFFFHPIFLEDRAFGYSVLSYGDEIKTYDTFYHSWMMFIAIGIEFLRRQILLTKLYDKMAEQAYNDSMTGVYNRNAFNEYAEEVLNYCRDNNEKIFVLIGDLNNLKHINDDFGHVDGDIAIKTCAAAITYAHDEVLSKEQKGNARVFRIGGDEFAIIGRGDYSEKDMSDLKAMVNKYTEAFNEREKKKYKVSISLGTSCLKVGEGDTIQKVISIADEEMFAEKQRYKNMNP